MSLWNSKKRKDEMKLACDDWVYENIKANWTGRTLFLTSNFTGGFNTGTYRHKGYLDNDIDTEINLNRLLKRYFRILEHKCFKRKNTTQIRRKNRLKRYIAIHRHTAKKHCHILINAPVHISNVRFYFYALDSLREANLIQDYKIFDRNKMSFSTSKAVTYANIHKSTGFCAYKLSYWDKKKKLVGYCNKEMEIDGHTKTIDFKNSYL